jgi:hypothetical protein
MEPKGSLQLLQEFVTCPYSEPGRSSPYPFNFLKIYFNTVLSSYPPLGLPNGVFPSGLPTKILYARLLSPIHATWFVYPMLLELPSTASYRRKDKGRDRSDKKTRKKT